jgi:hypothetical protein
MKLHNIKSEALVQELLDRCGDQMGDPEPQFDDILSFLTVDEIDWLMGELSTVIHKRKERVKTQWRNNG